MLRVKGWKKFQHYKDRTPPWIKLSRELLHNRKWFNLSHASRSLAIIIWLVASEHEDPTSGLLDDNPEELAFRARMKETEIMACVKELINQGFIEHVQTDDSDLLAPCYQDACLEAEAEAEDNNKGGKPKKEKISLNDLSVDHIADWLGTKRVAGVYTNIDEHRLLEMFKDYCTSKSKTYKDYVAAFRNAFEWNNTPKKGTDNENNRKGQHRAGKSDQAKAAIMRGIE